MLYGSCTISDQAVASRVELGIALTLINGTVEFDVAFEACLFSINEAGSGAGAANARQKPVKKNTPKHNARQAELKPAIAETARLQCRLC